MQDAEMDGGQKVHAALVNVECHSAIAPDQLILGSCMNVAIRLYASERDYWDTWGQRAEVQGSLEVFRVRGPEVRRAADGMKGFACSVGDGEYT